MTTTTTPDPRAIWESLTPAQRDLLGSVVHWERRSGTARGWDNCTADVLCAGMRDAGLLSQEPDPFGRLDCPYAWWRATDLGRAVAAAGRGQG